METEGTLNFLVTGIGMERTTPPIETISPFAIDPFVAQAGAESAGHRKARSVKEILDSINGYRDPEQATAMSSNRNSANPPTAGDWTDWVEENQMPEFDTRIFGAAEELDAGLPDPIRCGFEVDQDFFDYAAIDRRIDQAASLQSEGPAVVKREDAIEQPTAPEIFWAKAGEVIYIDGNDGYGFIDLACFNISAASFQANQIQIQQDDGSQFQIDYRNVSHAVFAEGVEVELVANDTDAESEI